MKTLLNIVIAVNVVTVILSACMVDSESMVPAYVCAASTLALMVSGWMREWLYGSYKN
jgi:hypothetical protein